MVRSTRLLAFAALVALVACGQDNPAAPPVVSTVVVTPGADTIVTLGRTRQFTAVARDGSGNPVSGVTLVWHSSNPSVATVDSVTGLVTAIANGSAQIRADASGVIGQATVAVVQVVAGVQVTPASRSFTVVGDTQRFVAVAKDSGGATVQGVRFLWGSSNQSVATVDTLGLATSRGAGQATISAAGRGVPGYAALAVNQVPVHLVFAVLPVQATAGEAINPAVQVEVQDAAGHIVTGSRASITIGLGRHPGSAVLHGSTTVNAVGGIATFSGLSLEQADSQYTLMAVSAGVGTDSTPVFAIVPAPPVRVTISTPGFVNDGKTFVLSASLYDRFGNFAWNATDVVYLDLYASTWPGEIYGNTIAAPVAGVASFTGLRFSRPGAFTLRVSPTAGPATVATPMTQHVHFLQIATGVDHSCGLAGQAIFCWGANDQDQLGSGTSASDSVPVLVNSNVAFASVGTGGMNSCGLSTGGAVYCWGNLQGTLESVPVLVPAAQSFTTLAVGYEDACALTSAGAAYCWGNNVHGAIGDSTTNPSPTPVAVRGGHTFTAMTVGADYTCGLATGGTAYCWGYNTSGQLGNGTLNPALVPTLVSGGLVFSTIKAGAGHACGLSGGAAYCWGNNFAGQTGDTAPAGRDSVPIAVTGGLTFSAIVPGATHTCARSASASYCWGDNAFGALGSAAFSGPTPTAVTGGLTFSALAGGTFRSCGLVSGGQVYCWGHNNTGAIGDGTTTDRSTPTAVVQQ